MSIWRFISHLIEVLTSNYQFMQQMRREDRERAKREEAEQQLALTFAQLAPSYANFLGTSTEEALALVQGLVHWITVRMVGNVEPSLNQLVLQATILHSYDEWDKAKIYEAYEAQRQTA